VPDRKRVQEEILQSSLNNRGIGIKLL